MQKYVVTSEPAIEPVSSADLKLQVRIDHTEEDTLLGYIIAAARLMVERWTGRALITQTRKALFQRYAVNFPLPGAPAQSITSLKCYNTAGVATTVSAGNYILDTINSVLHVLSTGTLPSIDLQEIDPVEIIYICGYGAAATAVPAPLKHAVMLLAAHYYEHREAVTLGNTAAIASAPVAFGLEALIEPYIVRSFI